MAWLEVLRMMAAVTTVVAAVLVAANWSPRTTVAGFVLFMAASLCWIIDGWIDDKFSLLVQNAVLLLINAAGIYRWLPRT